MICAPFASTPCDIGLQDCGGGSKCVGTPFDEGVYIGTCASSIGEGVPGDPCTARFDLSFGDNCDANSMCWAEQNFGITPYEGVCRQFCGLGDPACPDPTECEPLGEGFSLCTAPE